MFFSVAALVVFLDQMSKFFAGAYLQEGQRVGSSFAGLVLVGNTGTAFGLFKGVNSLFLWLTVFIIGAMLYFYSTRRLEKMGALFLSLVLGGAIGNLIDRVMFGYVADFVSISVWPAFNVADCAITIGAIGLIVHYWNK